MTPHSATENLPPSLIAAIASPPSPPATFDPSSHLSLTINPSDTPKLVSPWINSVTFKVVGKSLSFDYLKQKIIPLWKLPESIKINTLGKGFYNINTPSPQEQQRILGGGPWFIGKLLVHVQPWTPGFRASEARITTAPVWIALPELPIEFHNQDILRQIGNKVGSFIKSDPYPLFSNKFLVARIMVLVDLSKPKKSSIWIGNYKQSIVYENPLPVCNMCETIGHDGAQCPKSVPSQQQQPPQKDSVKDSATEEEEWIKVQRNRGRNSKPVKGQKYPLNSNPNKAPKDLSQLGEQAKQTLPKEKSAPVEALQPSNVVTLNHIQTVDGVVQKEISEVPSSNPILLPSPSQVKPHQPISNPSPALNNSIKKASSPNNGVIKRHGPILGERRSFPIRKRLGRRISPLHSSTSKNSPTQKLSPKSSIHTTLPTSTHQTPPTNLHQEISPCPTGTQVSRPSDSPVPGKQHQRQENSAENSIQMVACVPQLPENVHSRQQSCVTPIPRNDDGRKRRRKLVSSSPTGFERPQKSLSCLEALLRWWLHKAQKENLPWVIHP
uniref:DUF4283 domain-containing protein n=1 Tax=Chenopodium quinoa TaxID=63459 RepID=A0A803LTV7_CHEQI